ncbi:MAG: DUF4198 domain-containing protein [Vicinamibacterales bacterium]
MLPMFRASLVGKTRNSLLIAFTIGIAALAVVGLAAHEFWVTAARWQVAPSGRLTILANVGSVFPAADSFTTPDRVASVRLVGPQTDLTIPPPYRREADSLAADIAAPSTPGTYVGVFAIRPRTAEKSGAVFEEHLKHQGLRQVAAERAARGETAKAVRERYSRYGKTLITVGSGGDRSAATRPLGLKLELVPLVDPTGLAAGSRLRVRLLLDGKPLPGALAGAIYAGSKVAPDQWPLTAVTDARGEAEFLLEHRGPWLVRAVTMQRREDELGPDAADWETYWASLTFRLRQ